MTACFIEPVDVLYLRGNRLFGGAGEHGEALMPPWPSVASGAVRSHLLACAEVNLEDYAAGHVGLIDTPLAALGTPEEPGNFTLRWFSPALRQNNAVQPVFPLPQDVFIPNPDKDKARPSEVHMLQPQPLPAGVRTSATPKQVAVLKRDNPAKPASGWWLNEAGLVAWVEGKPLIPDHLIATNKVWSTEQRLGIARDAMTATAAEGQIYTTETIAFRHGQAVRGGFLALVDGIAPDALPDGLLRFGGDGRAARLQRAEWQLPEPDWQRIERQKACRILLTTPGLFPGGWRLPGMDASGNWQLPDGSLKGRVVAAAISRSRTVSGWDLTVFSDPRRERGKRTAGLGHPKPAQRSVPVGSVYWLTELEGGIETGLRRLMDEGLWAAMDKMDRHRRAEGFNNCLIGAPGQN